MEQNSSIHILVVDDEPPIFDLLQRLGHQLFPEAQFISTRSGQECLDYLANPASVSPQLILLDIDLHQSINGLELLPQLRSLLKGQAPIIILTVSDSNPDIQQAYDAGAVAYTRKPETLEDWKFYISMLKEYWYRTSMLPGLAT